jgi:hypothetical protein
MRVNRGGFNRWLPGPGDLVFGVVLGMILVGGHHGLLNDPGTPWHLRLGREIIATGSVPYYDTLTYTRDHAPWVDQSWAFDFLLAVVVDRWGWAGAIALAALGLAWLYRAVARGLISDGITPVVAVAVTLLAVAVGSIHFLIRPHLFTFAFVYLTLRACRQQHRNGGWAVLLAPVYTALLANLHGGFVALPVIVATAAIGHTVSGPWDAARRGELVKFGLAGAACVAAGLINPYGLGLYRHVGHLLVSSGVTGLIIEYQPPQFGKPDAEVLEWVLLGMVGLPALSSRRIGRYELCQVLVWLHLALTSIRNAPLFALVAAPALATLIDGLPLALRNVGRRAERAVCLPAAATVLLLVLVMSGARLGGFDLKKWPLQAIGTLNQQPATARLFHEQDWGGLIAEECQPVRRSYLDDRFELFGKTAILEYIDVLTGGPAWDKVHKRDRIDMVWLRPDRGLSKRLLVDPRWFVIYRDNVSILFKQATTGQLTAR